MHILEKRIAVAMGAVPADFAVTGASVFNVFTGEFAVGEVLVSDGSIAAILPEGSPVEACEIVDGSGMWLLPGFIDAHVHMENSMVNPVEYASHAAVCGVTTIIADPHELCNVYGIEGLHFMLEATERASARVFFMLPSCVPTSPLRAAATSISPAALKPYLDHPRVLGLGEMMNYPGVVLRDQAVLGKLELVHAYNRAHAGFRNGLALDGHAPCVGGRALQAYVTSGIRSNHEATNEAEAYEHIAAGMTLMLREGGVAKNLLDLVPAVTMTTAHRCLLCTDDRNPQDLAREGSINYLVCKLVADGRIPLHDIIRMASWNAASHYGLRGTGAIAPGYRADFALYPDLASFVPSMVWNGGLFVASGGKSTRVVSITIPERLRNSVKLDAPISSERLLVPDKGFPVKAISLVPRQVLTTKLSVTLPAENGFLTSDVAKDIAKLAVFERHGKTGGVSLGFVKGLGLRRGAVATTVSHDAHNLVVAGMNDKDMVLAVESLRACGGGCVVVFGGRVLSLLPLPLAGLFAEQPLAEVAAAYEHLVQAAQELGTPKRQDPFMALSFLCLEVVPSLRLTEAGLVDVDAFAVTSLYETGEVEEGAPDEQNQPRSGYPESMDLFLDANKPWNGRERRLVSRRPHRETPKRIRMSPTDGDKTRGA